MYARHSVLDNLSNSDGLRDSSTKRTKGHFRCFLLRKSLNDIINELGGKTLATDAYNIVDNLSAFRTHLFVLLQIKHYL